LRHHGIRVLRNESVPISKEGAKLWLVGLDDAWSGYPDPDTALQTAPATAARILLVHEPDYADVAARYPFDLQLSGHSHGGQVRLPFLNAIVVPVFQWIARFLSEHGDNIQGVLSGAWEVIKGVISVALDIIQGILRTALAIVRGDWDGAWQAIKTMFSNVWADLQGIVRGEVEILKNLLGGAWQSIQDGAGRAWNGIKDAIANAFSGVVNGIKGTLNEIIDAVNRAIEAFNQLPGPDIGTIPRLALGTLSFAGGLALVGEHGPELVSLPRGAAVYPAGETARMLGGDTYYIDARGATWSEGQIRAQFEAALRAVGRAAEVRGRTR
jgi:hypothetical protein